MNLDSSRTRLKNLLLVRVIRNRDRYFLNRPDLVIFSTSSNLLKMVSKVSALNSSFSSNRLIRLRRSLSVASVDGRGLAVLCNSFLRTWNRRTRKQFSFGSEVSNRKLLQDLRVFLSPFRTEGSELVQNCWIEVC